MDKEKLYQYILDNFTLDGTSKRLVSNILDFVKKYSNSTTEAQTMLYELLECIGIEKSETQTYTT